jgi:protein-S-isoprenylcysteine O-methyltransferase Ste14
MDPIFFHYNFIAVFLAFMVIRVAYQRIALRTRGKVDIREGNLAKVMRLVWAVPLLAVLITYMVRPDALSWAALPLPEWAQWLGLAMAWGALPLLWWVHWALGSNFSGLIHIRDEHTLVTHGPYRWVRHPMYTVFYVYMTGLLLLTSNWLIGGLFLLGVTLAVIPRLPREEALMIEKFGDTYREYMKRTGRFLPRLGANRA